MDFNINGNVISIDNETLKEALESDAKDLTIESDLIVRTKEQENEWFNNAKKGTIDTAFEMKIKELKNSLGLDFEGKTFDNLINSLTEKNKAEFTKEPSKQLEDKDKDIKLLQSNIQALTQEKESIFNEYTTYKNTSYLDNTLGKYMPKNIKNTPEDMAIIIKNRLGFDVNDNQIITKKNGEVLKDDLTLTPLPMDKVMEKFFSENPHYLNGAEGGQGGKDSTQEKAKGSLDAFNDSFVKSGGNIGGSDYNRALNQAVINGEVKV